MKTKNNHPNPRSLPRYFRLAMGLSQAKLAELCEVATMDISRLERGIYSLHISKARRIAAVLGVSVHALANDDYTIAPPKLSRIKRNPGLKTRTQKIGANKKRIGNAGEAFVADRERLKLKGTRYADSVNEAFADDPNTGYDIFSFTRYGEPLFIEVKTTVGRRDDVFFMTENEKAFMEKCRRDGLNYELHRVYKLNKKGVGKVAVYTLKDLENFEFQTGIYAVTRRKNND